MDEQRIANENIQESTNQSAPTTTCIVCGKNLVESEYFCPVCGTPVAATQQQLPSNETNPADKKTKKKGKKKKGCLLGLVAIIAAIVLIIGGRAVFTAIRHSSGMSRNESIVEDYRTEDIDYEEAVSKISKLKESKDSEVAAGGVEAEKKIEKLKKSKDHFAKGTTYKNKKDYSNAVLHFNLVIEADINYTTAQNEISEIVPLWKKTLPTEIDRLLEEGNKDEALELIDTFMGYESDNSINNIKLFLEAEDYLDKGYLNSANDIYKKLPKELTVNKISVQSRLDKLSKYSAFLAMCGKWQTTKYYYKSLEDWDYGSDYWWYNDGSTASRYLTVACKINDDGSVTVNGNAEFKIYTNYSSVTSNLNTSVFDSDFSKNLKASDKTFSLSFSTGDFTRGNTQLNDKQKISFDGKKFTHTFSVKYTYSRSCDEIYSSDVTFGKRVEKY